jgi:hypothetical protein
MNTTQPQEIFLKVANARVRQDKKPPGRLTATSSEPSTATFPAVNTAKHHGSETRRTDFIGGRILPDLKTAFLLVAEQNGWTKSYALSKAVEAFLVQDLGQKFGLRIAAVVETTINKTMEKQTNRLAKLNVKGFLAAEQARIMNIQTLRYILGEEGIGELPRIIEESKTHAWDNLKYNHEETQPM